jgi:predicted phosphodiesterase
MLPFTIIVPVIAVAALLLALVNFRFLMYPVIPSLNPIAHAKRLSLRGNTLFISDLHLKSDQPFKYAKDLRNFIETNNVSNLIIDGDLFDSPRDAQEVLGGSRSQGNVLKVLGLGGLPAKLFWVSGSPAHDPTRDSIDAQGLETLGKCALLDCGRLEVLAYHGHDISHTGVFAHAWDRFVSELSLERLWKRLAKVDKTVWVVFGHTHIPGIDAGSRVANCGGWLRKPLVTPSGTGILISEGEDAPKLVRIAQ